MTSQQIQKAITTSQYTLPVAIIISIVFGSVSLVLLPDFPEKEVSYPIWSKILEYCFPSWWNKVACLILYFIIGYSLSAFNNQFGLTRMRVALSASLFFLFLSACPGSYVLCAGDVATFAFLLSIYYLFESYQQHKSSKYLFHSAFFTGIGSIFYPQLTYFIPVLIIGAYNFRSLNIRSFFALLIGWSVPYWFLFGYAFPTQNMHLFYQPFIELVNFQPVGFDYFQTWELITLGYIFCLCIISAVHSYITSFRDKIRTRLYLRFFILLNACVFLFILLQPAQYVNLLPLLLVNASILTAHLYLLSNSGTAAGFFIISMIISLSLFGFNMWMLLSDFKLT
ncbi:hypothetical protein EZS27_003627 [termite gut metagenome]|uniref:Glycosyltransferase RgtA/B/C/D-like domain-containing protein n=1 Tax=termite gut metagenome TaxID=433724 RepID=A0A5J4SS10_9ZZZZ